MHICMHFNTLKIFDKEIRCKLTSEVSHTGLEALPSKKKWSIDGTGVPEFLRPVWYWDGVLKPEKMGKKLNLDQKLVKNT